MICVRLEGGLGNQLFQHAAGRALALRHSTSLCWDLGLLERPPGKVTRRPFELGLFRVQGAPAQAAAVRGLRWMGRLGAASQLVSRWRVHREGPGGYDPAFESLPDHSYLVGYWQSWRYLAPLAARLASEFEPVQALSAASRGLQARQRERETIALHVRRGDYVSLPSAAGFHGVLPAAYYVEALARLGRLAPDAALMVFSDDPGWCRANLPTAGRESCFVDHNQGGDAWQDLVLMAGCRHHVIANSSFSWWGAWLADQRQPLAGRQVFAPARWFSAAPIAAADRFPPHWQVLG